MKRVLAMLAVMVMMGHTLAAQVDRAALTGVIKDANGVLPGAMVTLTNTATSVDRPLVWSTN